MIRFMPSSNFLLSKFQGLGEKTNNISQRATGLTELHGDFFKFFSWKNSVYTPLALLLVVKEFFVWRSCILNISSLKHLPRAVLFSVSAA